MSKCRWCGKTTNGHKTYCDNVCMQNYKYNIERGEKGVIGTLCRYGAKILAVRVIKQAVSDKDFRWICSKNSDLFFDLAGITKEEIMNCFDDDLNLIRQKN